MVNEITIQNLAKHFDDVKAANGLNFEIRKGELFSLLGPNGAGKTTTIRMLCRLLAPSAGTATDGDLDIRKDLPKIKARIGVCPQEAVVFKFLTGKENIELMGNLHGLVFMSELLETGEVIPVINRTFPLTELPEAMQYLGSRQQHGKIIITIDQL